jgi:hypothetical protein
MTDQSKIDFDAINQAASHCLLEVVRELLPEGRLRGAEWIALNPTRPDRRAGSFKVNIVSGKWADFATGDSGGDIVSLVAYVYGVAQSVAARRLAEILRASL